MLNQHYVGSPMGLPLTTLVMVKCNSILETVNRSNE